ncbi:MAG: hypothetical protein ACI8W8_000095 [Rhodothermales bacterium]|jgi:hypothetical protein
MPRHLSAIAFAWVATLAAAFIAGRVAGPLLPPESADPAAIEAQELRTSQSPAPETRSSQPRSIAGERAASVPRSVAWPQASKVAVPVDVLLRNALQEPDAVEKMLGIAEVLRQVDATTIASLLAEFDAQGNRDEWSSMQYRQLLFFKWGALNGDAAMTYLDENSGNKHHKRYLTSSVLSGWASEDADSAIAWAQENHEGEDNPHMMGIISGLAKTDLGRASELLQSLPYGSNRGRAAQDVVRAHLRQGEENAQRWASDLPGNELKDGVVSMVVRELAKDSPQRAAEWLGTMDDIDPKKSVNSIARQWARESPEEAADWVAKFDDEDTRKSSLPQVISQWASHDIQAAGNWLREYPATPDRDAAIASYVYRIARTDAESAQAWANSIVDEKQRERATKSIAQITKHQNRGNVHVQ